MAVTSRRHLCQVGCTPRNTHTHTHAVSATDKHMCLCVCDHRGWELRGEEKAVMRPIFWWLDFGFSTEAWEACHWSRVTLLEQVFFSGAASASGPLRTRQNNSSEEEKEKKIRILLQKKVTTSVAVLLLKNTSSTVTMKMKSQVAFVLYFELFFYIT